MPHPELSSKIHAYNTDTGAIGGFDAENGAGAVISVADAVPNTGPGYELTAPVKNPTSGFNAFWEGEDNVLVPDKGQLFETVEMVTVDNIQSHNLKTIESSNATLVKIEELLESLSSESARCRQHQENFDGTGSFPKLLEFAGKRS